MSICTLLFAVAGLCSEGLVAGPVLNHDELQYAVSGPEELSVDSIEHSRLEERQALIDDESRSLKISSSIAHNNQFWPFSSPAPVQLTSASLPDPAYYCQYLDGHNVFTNSIQLRDGSTWFGPFNTGLIASKWYATDPVVISPSNRSTDSYKFCATNQRTGESIKINLGSPPRTDGPYARYITAVDGNGVVYLSDGSLWMMSPFDKKVVSEWWIYDPVIIGLNHNKDSNLRPNILINVAKKNYASCTFTQ